MNRAILCFGDEMNEQMLAESENFKVVSEFEAVSLVRKSGSFSNARDKIIIGDFYGDPTGAVILVDESFVLCFGAGFILYQLAEPFEPYEYGKFSAQWVEKFRGPENIWWIDKAQQEFANTFLFRVSEGDDHAGIYRLKLPEIAVEQLGTPGTYTNTKILERFLAA